ncbi:MAG TPA: MarC family protein [Reyranella sp.]|jgi:multiple antibiotic resistance protein|nr:MarC family protein [Reyranella sp.]
MPDLATLLSAFVTLLVTIGPFETAPVFGTLTAGMTRVDRRRTARRAVAIAGSVLLIFALAGERVLGVLHVSLPALRTAGGVLLFLEAVNLMTASPGTSAINPEERAEARPPRDITVFPLAFPLIAGPGSLMAVILLMSNARGSLLLQVGILLVLALCLGITLAAYVMVDGLKRVLGVTGTDVVGRISGLLLAAMAMQFVFDGVTEGLLK